MQTHNSNALRTAGFTFNQKKKEIALFFVHQFNIQAVILSHERTISGKISSMFCLKSYLPVAELVRPQMSGQSEIISDHMLMHSFPKLKH